jgi:2-aminoethylphosphonate-pyruvate transaminase
MAIPSAHDKLLFTPGPLTTSQTVKQALLKDYGSRDLAFVDMVREIRHRLVELGGVSNKEYTTVIMQGSGTFGLEAVVASCIPPNGKLLIAVNGAYGRRIARMTKVLGINMSVVEYAENLPVQAKDVAEALERDSEITHVCVVHCETTSGILNPIEQIGEVVRAKGKLFFVDAMSSFGGIPINLAECKIDYLVSSANKCIEGVPGFSFVLTRLKPFLQTKGWGRSLSLDLFEQYEAMEKDGQFRFTPPTSSLAAFYQALLELEIEGGIQARANRYKANFDVLLEGMRRLGFRAYLAREHMSHIITTFHYPEHPNFQFDEFYERLSAAGFLIYLGKVGEADCFRVGNIGRLFPPDMEALLAAMAQALGSMGIELSGNHEISQRTRTPVTEASF